MSPLFGDRSACGNSAWQMCIARTAWLAAALFVATCDSARAEIRSDERVVFFPTLARLSDDGQHWETEIHGWIFEPEADSSVRRKAVAALQAVARTDADSQNSAVFQQRIRLFLVDNERAKVVVIRCGDLTHDLEPSEADGHFRGKLLIPVAVAEKLATDGLLPFRAVTAANDERKFEGSIHLIPPTGLSVISDIDDTIKITEVTDKRKTLDNTFFQPFRAVDGMPALYRRWGAAGARFHFVSNSPWQLYPPLAEFAQAERFPAGTFHLKTFRLQDGGLWDLFADPVATKIPAIERLLVAYPRRKFVLVGDSGERDPEVYGRIARAFPEQVRGIFIRDVTNEPADAPRYAEAFREVPSAMWQVFRDPSRLALPADR